MTQDAVGLIETILRNTLKEPGARDKRGAQRVVLNLQVKVVIPGQRQAITGRLTNMSSTGVGLQLAQPLSHWSTFRLDLPGRDGDVIILCTVARCTSRGNGIYFIGAHFTQVLRGEQSIYQQAEMSGPARIK